MSRLLPAIAAASSSPSWPSSPSSPFGPDAAPTPAERADALARGAAMPDRRGPPVADSLTGSAAEIARQIDALIADGATDDAVRAHSCARYGQ